MDAGERALLEETISAALAARPANGDAVLTELGWLEMLDAEPDDAIAIVFDALGRTNANATVLDDVIAHALGTKPRPDLAAMLPGGLATARVATAHEVLLGPQAVVGVSEVDARPVRGIDPDFGLYEVRIEGLGGVEAPEALALGRRAVAQQIAGACRTMLDLARTHALERVQFGRPVAQFQAVRHRLAEALVAIEALDATLQAARDEPNALTAMLAKATAGRTAKTVTAHCQQVLAGIGFTTDHPFHRYLKRTMLLDGLFGNADALTVEIGEHLLAARRVPTLIEL
jgi:hypothetical protein